MLAIATGRLANAAGKAADNWRALLDSSQDYVAYLAAKSILELETKLREAGELDQWLNQLETIAQENRQSVRRRVLRAIIHRGGRNLYGGANGTGCQLRPFFCKIGLTQPLVTRTQKIDGSTILGTAG